MSPIKTDVHTWAEMRDLGYDRRIGGLELRMAGPFNRFGVNEQTGNRWAGFDAIDKEGFTGRCRWFDYFDMTVNTRFVVKEGAWRREGRLAIGEGWGGLAVIGEPAVEPDPDGPIVLTLEERVERLEAQMRIVADAFGRIEDRLSDEK